MNPDLPDDPVSEEASLWAARLDGGTLEAADRARLDAWLAADPARRELLSRYCQLSVDLDTALPELLAEGRLEVPERQPAIGRRWAIWAAALAAAAAVALAVGFGPWSRHGELMSAEAGRSRSFTLADGSVVQLNANTSITVSSDRSFRRVHLADGEAFFEVSKDASRPFIVDTPAGSVRVTGTKFDVRTEAPDQMEVIVVEGSVRVQPSVSGAEPVAIGPGDRLSITGGSVALKGLSAASVNEMLGLRSGFVVCRGMPLAELAARMAHYHSRRITVSPRAATVMIGGRFSLADIDQFLGDLKVAEPGLVVSPDGAGGFRIALQGEAQ